MFWGVAYFRMRKADGGLTLLKERSFVGILMAALNILIILTGVFFLTAGTYASVQAIVDEFDGGGVGGVFSCASNGL